MPPDNYKPNFLFEAGYVYAPYMPMYNPLDPKMLIEIYAFSQNKLEKCGICDNGFSHLYEYTTFYFCSEECKTMFRMKMA